MTGVLWRNWGMVAKRMGGGPMQSFIPVPHDGRLASDARWKEVMPSQRTADDSP